MRGSSKCEDAGWQAAQQFLRLEEIGIEQAVGGVAPRRHAASPRRAARSTEQQRARPRGAEHRSNKADAARNPDSSQRVVHGVQVLLRRPQTHALASRREQPARAGEDAQAEPALRFSTTSGRACRRLFARARSACQDIQIRGLRRQGASDAGEEKVPAAPTQRATPARRRRGARRTRKRRREARAVKRSAARSSLPLLAATALASPWLWCLRRRPLDRRDVPASRAAPANLRAHAARRRRCAAAATAASTTACGFIS